MTLPFSLLLIGTATSIFRSKQPSRSNNEMITLQAKAWEEMDDPALIFDNQGNVLTYNCALEELVDLNGTLDAKYKFAEMLGEDPGSNIETAWVFENLDRLGNIRGFEITLKTSRHGVIKLEGNAQRLSGRNDSANILVWRDVTDRSRRERALVRRLKDLDTRYLSQTEELAKNIEELAQANKELQELDAMRSDLISLVSHQIRAPLTNMLGAMERMQSGCPSPTSMCQQMFSVLRDQSLRLNRLVRDVLSLARLESGDLVLQLEPLSLMPVVREAVEQVGARGERKYRIPFVPVLPLIMADKDRLTEVLINLFDNADKYSPPNADIEIEIRPTESEVIVTVLDSGPGLSADELTRVFDKFYRAETGDAQRTYGYGLGLYICRALIEGQGGRIWATNREEGGASFSFSLPVAKQ